MGMMATVRINTSQGFVLFRDCTLQETDDGWIALDENFHEEVARGRTLFACIDAVEAWHDGLAEAAWLAQQERLMESGSPDDSAYRRDMINAGRGHLLGRSG